MHGAATPSRKQREVLRPVDPAKATDVFDVLVNGKMTQRRAFVRLGKKLKSKRFPKAMPTREVKQLQEDQRVAYRQKGDVAAPGTLAADMEEYRKAVAGMPTLADRMRDLYEWRPVDRRRRQRAGHFLPLSAPAALDRDPPRTVHQPRVQLRSNLFRHDGAASLALFKDAKAWTFSRGTLRMRLIYYARQLSIEGIRPYDLRHSIATALRNAGADLSDVAEHLGHTTLRMTKRYAPFQADKLRAAAERL